MARGWTGDPGSLDYWRSDNPCLINLMFFGDDEPPPPIGALLGPWSRLRKDSGPTKWHPNAGTIVDNAAFETNIGVATVGLAPSQTYDNTSGIIFNGTSWTDASHGQGFGADYGDYGGERGATGSATHGGMGTWSFSNMSGLTVCGWCQLRADVQTTNNPTNHRLIVGIHEQYADTAAGGWGLYIRPSDMSLEFQFVGGDNTLHTVNTASSPFNPTPGEPFFFAAQISRNRANEAGMAYDTCVGSGIMRIMIGTEASGLIDVVQHEIAPRTNICGKGLDSNNVLSYGSVGDQVDGISRVRHLPADSILDDVAVMNDTPHPCGLEVLRLNGWKHVPETSDVEHSSFIPVNPGTEDLVGYWDWTDGLVDGVNINQPDQEFCAPNKAPATSGIVPLAFIAPRQNVNVGATFGGVGNAAGKPFTGTSMRPNLNGGGGNITGVVNSSAGIFIPAGSGVNHLFPETNPGKEGWTWIYWARSICDFIFGVGTCQDARDIGWQHKTITDNNTKFVENFGEGGQLNPAYYNVNYIGSGVTKPGRWYFPTNGMNRMTLRPTLRNEWQLRAVVWQTDYPMVYNFYDGAMLMFAGQRVSPLSGFSKEGFVGQGVGQEDPGVFRLTHTGPTLSTSHWGPVAVYNRILSVAEMSGFANSGIDIPPVVSPISTDFKQTRGYWPLDEGTLETYDPEAVSGSRFNDESWYRHHLTNISGLFSFNATALNVRTADESLQVDLSGSMLSIERELTGSNLDFSTVQDMGPSGFSVGCWMYLPSGDLQTQGNGSSGLFGEHMFMGAWSQDVDERSWFLGLVDGTVRGRVVLDNGTVRELSTNRTPIFNEPFFVGMDIQPSGGSLLGRIVYSEDATDQSLFFEHEGTFGTDTNFLQSSSASGFSILNAPNLQFGFPSGTRINNAFIYAGAPPEVDWVGIKKASVNITSLGSGSVSVTDPSNISLWHFDFAGSRFLDRGKENNTLYPINQDGNQGGVIGAIHGSGVVIRQPEYYDTLPFNSNSRRLDLGSGSQSWTFLTWVLPPQFDSTDRNYIMAKSDSLSGIQVFTPPDSLQLTSNASGAVTRAQNGNLAPGQWNHLAIVFDRDNNEFTTIINGRYAGASFEVLPEVPTNNSGMALGGRGDQQLNALPGGSAFSGYLDDTMLFSRALTLPEISGLAANSYNYDEGLTIFQSAPVGGWISGLPLFVISGLIGSFLHGQAQDLELVAGYVSGVSGLCIPYGGFIHGKAQVSGAPALGHFLWGADRASGVFGHFVHGLDIVSGFIGHYQFGACQALGEFDIVLNFSVITNKDFDARLGVEKTQFLDFDARLGVVRITQPPECTIEAPLIGEVASGVPYTLTVQGSGIAKDNKKVSKVRFTFADFKGAEDGTLLSGEPNSGLYSATRVLDTPGWYTVKIEVLDSYGYRTSCCRPFLLLPSGVGSGTFLNSLPGVSIETSQVLGSAIHTASFVHSISGLATTSGILEYTDFADQQETLVNSLEMPLNTQFVDFVRRHDYTMPGRYCPVWSVSGEFGIVSDTISDGIDYLE